MSGAEKLQLQSLTEAQKLCLIEGLWDALATILDDMPVSEEEKAILEERLHSYQQAPEQALTLEVFKQRLAERMRELYP